MKWRLFDSSVVFIFLACLFLSRLLTKDLFRLLNLYPSANLFRSISSIFFMYQSLSTLVLYGVVSRRLGLLLFHLRIILFRHTFNFFLLFILACTCFAIPLFALSYPDRVLSPSSVSLPFSWTMETLLYSPPSLSASTCPKSAISRPTSYCNMLNSNRDSQCASHSWPSHLNLLILLVSLKLILLPLLVAFYSKSAQENEAEVRLEWNTYYYGVVMDFSLRPSLPPPFTALFFIFHSCRSTRKSLFSLHPDISDKIEDDKAAVYRNVVHTKEEESVWREESIKRWRKNREEKDDGMREDTILRKQLRAIALKASLEKTSHEMPRVPYSSEVSRLAVPPFLSSWSLVLPSYSPPFYSKPSHLFPASLQSDVEETTLRNLSEVRESWRNRQSSALLSSWTSPTRIPILSPSGLPLNPNGRTGICGRGNHVKFGPNILVVYVIINDDKVLLISTTPSLPAEYKFGNSSRDENLLCLLRLIGIPEAEASMFSLRDETLEGEWKAKHILSRISPCGDDTDNAWREEEAWKIHLGKRRVLSTLIGYTWSPISEASSLLSSHDSSILSSALSI